MHASLRCFIKLSLHVNLNSVKTRVGAGITSDLPAFILRPLHFGWVGTSCGIRSTHGRVVMQEKMKLIGLRLEKFHPIWEFRCFTLHRADIMGNDFLEAIVYWMNFVIMFVVLNKNINMDQQQQMKHLKLIGSDTFADLNLRIRAIT